MYRAYVVGASLLMICLSFGQAVAGLDLVGLYFDEGGEEHCRQDGIYESIDIFLIIKNPSVTSGVGGWQGTLAVDSGIILTDTFLYGDALNLGVGENYLVGLGEPMLQTDLVVLARFTVFPVYGGGGRFNALDGGEFARPVYLSGDAIPQFIPLYNEFGAGSSPSLTIGLVDCPEENGSGAVNESEHFWGGIKCIYR